MSGHQHGAHAHAGHAHTVRPDADAKRFALALILGFMVVEVVVGVLVQSLALLSDAAHMLTDAGALALSLIVIRLAARPAGGDLTFGLKRTEILSAQANGATLLVLAGLIIYEGVHRLISPPQPGGLAILVVAIAGIAVNLLATWQLSKANRESMNIEGSFQHILTDLFAFIATAIAGAVILATGFERADGIAALIVAAIMLRAAYGLLKDSGRVLLEAAPEGISVREVGEALAAHPHVSDIHDLHVWTVASGFPALSATCSSIRATTAMGSGASSNDCSTSASRSTTRRSRSTTPRKSASSTCRDSSGKASKMRAPTNSSQSGRVQIGYVSSGTSGHERPL